MNEEALLSPSQVKRLKVILAAIEIDEYLQQKRTEHDYERDSFFNFKILNKEFILKLLHRETPEETIQLNNKEVGFVLDYLLKEELNLLIKPFGLEMFSIKMSMYDSEKIKLNTKIFSPTELDFYIYCNANTPWWEEKKTKAMFYLQPNIFSLDYFDIEKYQGDNLFKYCDKMLDKNLTDMLRKIMGIQI
jgi:hypothetical protein